MIVHFTPWGLLSLTYKIVHNYTGYNHTKTEKTPIKVFILIQKPNWYNVGVILSRKHYHALSRYKSNLVGSER